LTSKPDRSRLNRAAPQNAAVLILLHFIYVTIGGDREFVGYATMIFQEGWQRTTRC